MPSIEFMDLLNKVQQKVRYVRTPEGATRYSLPIGSVIQGHPRPHVIEHRARLDMMATRGKPIQKIEPAKQAKRNYENFYDHYEGVYGTDWVWNGEPKPPAKMSEAHRRKNAIKESKALGISVNHAEGTQVDVYAHENINAVCRTMESMFPGFNQYIPNYNIDPTHMPNERWWAYNRMSTAIYGTDVLPRRGADGKTRDWDTTEIGLSNNAFGQGFSIDQLEAKFGDNVNGRWFALHKDSLKVAEQTHGRELWETAQIYAVMHEQGHTVARMAMGHMTQGPHDDFLTRGRNFMNDLNGIMDRHGLKVGPGDVGLIFNNNSPYSANWNHYAIDRLGVADNVSMYGASNLHEMLAETWAAYLMDDKPTKFVQEVGALLEENLVQYMADEKAARAVAKRASRKKTS